MLWRVGCMTALIAVLVGTFAGLGGGFAGARLAELAGIDTPGQERAITVIEGETDEPVAAVAAVAVPSVVNIDVTATRSVDPEEEDLPEGHPGVPIVGNGSGVAFKEDGEGGTYIITNDHVVKDASRIVVTDSEGERHDGDVVGTDPNTDIAVVHVPVEIPTIEIGDSDELIVGQLVIAIGSPFGLQQSVTSGVVSAIGRSLPDSSLEEGVYPLVDVIQTDAAVNPGNSGGALLDRQGDLVGINTAIFSDSGVNEGISFAVPGNTAVRVAEELIEGGSAQAPFLGVVGLSVTETLAEEDDLPVTEGALVVEITEDTEAEKAGIRPDDIIVGLDGEPIRSMDDLILAVRQSEVGDVVTLELWRDGEQMEIEMTVGVKPESLEL
jgi:S1-C subfamily serine protease